MIGWAIGLVLRLAHESKPVSGSFAHWFDIWGSDGSAVAQAHAQAAIDSMGERALPKLVGVLREVTRTHPLERVATRIGPILYESHRYAGVSSSMYFLARIDPQGKTVVPEVAALIDDPRHQPGRDWLVGELLRNYGNQLAVLRPWLIDWLKRGDSSQRLSVLRFLEETGPKAESLLPALLDRLAKAQGKERVRTIETLGSIGPAAAVACPRLRDFQNHPDDTVRMAAGTTLALIERQVDPALFTLLLDRLEHGSPSMRNFTEREFARLGAMARPAVPGLIHLLESGEGKTRECAARLLKAIAPHEAEASIAVATYKLEQERKARRDRTMAIRYGLIIH